MIENFTTSIIFLVILTFLDIKTFHLKEGYIPAVLTTSFLIVAFTTSGVAGLITGVFAFLIGMLLVDLDVFHGVADWKIFIACGMTLPTISFITIFGFFTTLLAVGYKFLLRKTKWKEIPFIPVLLIAYIGTMGVILL
ncbi:MAG: hypothetical protein ACE5ES_03550 [Candidatus Nanoarchaeia archaeon]